MRWGCCTTADNLALLEDIGYDYLELTMVSLADREQYDKIRTAVDKSNLRVEAFNVLLPSEIKVVGPEVDWDEIAGYIKAVLPRAADLGGKVVVFGSGRSRRVPEGFPQEKAREQMIDFLKFSGEFAGRHDLVIGIEPLRQAECNILNYVSEAAEQAEAVGLEQIGITADYYHMTEGEEPLENIVTYRDRLAHFHLADTGRRWPGSGQYDYSTFFRQVKAAGYDGRMSLECSFDNFPSNIETALAFLEDAWQKALE